MLLGEYAVLHGAPAMVVAVNRRVHVALQPAAGFTLTALGLGFGPLPFHLDGAADGQVVFADDPAVGAGQTAMVAAAVQAAWRLAAAAGTTLQPGDLRIDTRAFQRPDGGKLGIGSSAAVVVAVIAALLAQAEVLPEAGSLGEGAHGAADQAAAADGRASAAALLLPAALAAHRAAQGGRGSGVDVAASTLGGTLRYAWPPEAPAPQVVRLATRGPCAWQAASVGHPASTTALLGQVAALRAAEPGAYWQVMERLGIAAQAGVELWQLGDAVAFLTIVEAFYAALCALGEAAGAAIVTPAHQALHRLCATHQAAYKTSGAGGGDLGVAFLGPRCRRPRLLRAWQTAGAPGLDLAAEPLGLSWSKEG